MDNSDENNDNLLIKLMCALTYKDYDDLFYLCKGNNIMHETINSITDKEYQQSVINEIYRDYDLCEISKNKFNDFFVKINKSKVSTSEINDFIKLLIQTLYKLKTFYIDNEIIKNEKDIPEQMKEYENMLSTYALESVNKDNYIIDLTKRCELKLKFWIEKNINCEKIVKRQNEKIAEQEILNDSLIKSSNDLTVLNEKISESIKKLHIDMKEQHKINENLKNMNNSLTKKHIDISEEKMKIKNSYELLLLKNIDIEESLIEKTNQYKSLIKEFNEFKTTSNNKIKKIQTEFKNEKILNSESETIRKTTITNLKNVEKIIQKQNIKISDDNAKILKHEININTLNEELQKQQVIISELNELLIDKNKLIDTLYSNEEKYKISIMQQSENINSLNTSIEHYETELKKHTLQNNKLQQIINEYTQLHINKKIKHDKHNTNDMEPKKTNDTMIITFESNEEKDKQNHLLTNEQLINKLHKIEQKINKIEEMNYYYEKIISQQQNTCQLLYYHQYMIFQQPYY